MEQLHNKIVSFSNKVSMVIICRLLHASYHFYCLLLFAAAAAVVVLLVVLRLLDCTLRFRDVLELVRLSMNRCGGIVVLVGVDVVVMKLKFLSERSVPVIRARLLSPKC